jgi:hypothetical protein
MPLDISSKKRASVILEHNSERLSKDQHKKNQKKHHKNKIVNQQRSFIRMFTNSSQPTWRGVKESIKSHKGLMSDHAMTKAMTINIGQAHRKATSQIPQQSNTWKQVGEVGEPYSDSGHEIWATGIYEPCVLQAFVHHLYRTRRGWWLRAGVSEINLRNPALNHATRRGFHSPLHLTTWPSGMWTTTGKAWTVQVSQLKLGKGPSSGKIRPTRETITTMRTWAVTKASRLKAVLSWTKTMWAMVRSMSELRQSTWKSVRWSTRVKMRQNMRIRTRRKINELIMIWVSSILNMPPINSLPPEVII